jgi:hypothetical protein
MHNSSINARPRHPHSIARRVTLAIIGTALGTLSGFGLAQALPKMLSEEQGPRPFTEDELLKLGDAPPEGLIAYDSPSLIDTGVTKDKQQSVVARYILAQVGNRRVLALAPYNHSGNRLIGYLRVMDPTDRLHRDGLSLLDYSARDQVMKKFPDRPLAPYYFEVTEGRPKERVNVVIFGVMFLGGLLFVVVGGIFGRM